MSSVPSFNPGAGRRHRRQTARVHIGCDPGDGRDRFCERGPPGTSERRMSFDAATVVYTAAPPP